MVGVLAEQSAKEQEWIGLIAKTAQGDQTAFSVLYDQSSPQVYGLILRLVGNTHTAEEVMLDVFTQVWKQAHTYDRQRGTAGGWLMTLARTRAIDRIRAGRTERATFTPMEEAEWLPSNQATPEAQSVEEQQRRILQQALEALSSEQRQPILMAYFGGYSQSEIAERLGIPLGTIKTRMRLGMIKLRDLLAPYGEGLV
ncbi:MAG: sigma-70 family RNA polymerase sigma factor [Nitrospiraceae bacterium]